MSVGIPVARMPLGCDWRNYLTPRAANKRGDEWSRALINGISYRDDLARLRKSANAEFDFGSGVILSAAVFQAEGRISRRRRVNEIQSEPLLKKSDWYENRQD